MSTVAVTTESRDGIVMLRLDRPPGNVLGIDLCRQLRAAVGSAAEDRRAKLLVIGSAHDHFSFGASVEEHLPETAPDMLAQMRELVMALYAFPYPTLAAVRGRCLGGGLELALACDLLIVEESAVLAAPEIRLGVFAPAATALLQSSVPRCVAAEVLLTGRDLSAAEACRWGIVNRVVADGDLEVAVSEFATTLFVPRSAASLRQAVRAYRAAGQGRDLESIGATLARLERQYIDDLLPLPDGTEGIRAFLDKREPVWEEG